MTLGKCECLNSIHKDELIELVDEAIEFESETLDGLKEGTQPFNYILENRSEHENLLLSLKRTPECK